MNLEKYNKKIIVDYLGLDKQNILQFLWNKL